MHVIRGVTINFSRARPKVNNRRPFEGFTSMVKNLGKTTALPVIPLVLPMPAPLYVLYCTSYSDHAHCSQPMGENGVTKGNSRAGRFFFLFVFLTKLYTLNKSLVIFMFFGDP